MVMLPVRRMLLFCLIELAQVDSLIEFHMQLILDLVFNFIWFIEMNVNLIVLFNRSDICCMLNEVWEFIIMH